MGIYQPQLMAVTVLQGWLGLNTWQKHSVSSCKDDIVSMFPDDMFQIFCNILPYFAIFFMFVHEFLSLETVWVRAEAMLIFFPKSESDFCQAP